MARYSDEPKRPFYEQTRRAQGGCIEWTGRRNPQGYGVARKFLGEPEEKRAHRRSWIMAHGEIPKGLLVLHVCDNPPCVNPDHLFLGTNMDNSRDKHAKGRGKYLRGASHGCAKLSDEDVLRIREASLFGARRIDLAKGHGVSVSLISAIRARTQWSHLE